MFSVVHSEVRSACFSFFLRFSAACCNVFSSVALFAVLSVILFDVLFAVFPVELCGSFCGSFSG